MSSLANTHVPAPLAFPTHVPVSQVSYMTHIPVTRVPVSQHTASSLVRLPSGPGEGQGIKGESEDLPERTTRLVTYSCVQTSEHPI